MKKWVLIMILGFASVCTAQETLSDEEYVYPVLPGTEEWEKFDNLKQKQDACQIPPERLAKMSTKALVQACLDYPMFGNFAAYDIPQRGFNSVMDGFNGLQELMRRKDACKNLLAVYPLFDPSKTTRWPTRNKVYWSLFPNYLDVLVAQKDILLNGDKALRKILLAEARKRLEQKKAKYLEYSPFGQEHTVFLMAKILDIDGALDEVKKVNPKMAEIIEVGALPDAIITDEVIKIAKEKLK